MVLDLDDEARAHNRYGAGYCLIGRKAKSTHGAETMAYVEISLFGEIGCMLLITGVVDIGRKKRC